MTPVVVCARRPLVLPDLIPGEVVRDALKMMIAAGRLPGCWRLFGTRTRRPDPTGR